MGLLDFFKREPKPQEKGSKDRYWSLTTYEGEVVNPTWEQIKMAVDQITTDGTRFASLGYLHSGLEIEIIQAVGDGERYRFEALPADGKIYVNKDITYEETLKYFEDFYKYQRVAGFRSWPTEKV